MFQVLQFAKMKENCDGRWDEEGQAGEHERNESRDIGSRLKHSVGPLD